MPVPVARKARAVAKARGFKRGLATDLGETARDMARMSDDALVGLAGLALTVGATLALLALVTPWLQAWLMGTIATSLGSGGGAMCIVATRSRRRNSRTAKVRQLQDTATAAVGLVDHAREAGLLTPEVQHEGSGVIAEQLQQLRRLPPINQAQLPPVQDRANDKG